MTAVSKDMLGDLLIVAGRRIKSGKCEMSQEQIERVFGELESAVDVPISKEQACGLLGMSRSTFDSKVASGIFPKGKHRRGFKELCWDKNELIKRAKNERKV